MHLEWQGLAGWEEQIRWMDGWMNVWMDGRMEVIH